MHDIFYIYYTWITVVIRYLQMGSPLNRNCIFTKHLAIATHECNQLIRARYTDTPAEVRQSYNIIQTLNNFNESFMHVNSH